MKNKKSKSIIISIVVLCLAALLLPLEAWAWFAFSDLNKADNIDLDVIGQADATIDVTLGNDNLSEAVNIPVMLPSHYVAAKLNISNTSSEDKHISVKLLDIKVIYPTSALGYRYDNNMVMCQDYYKNGVFFDTSSTMTESLFRKFVSPVTNAVQYDLYAVEGNSFADGYSPKYLSGADKATDSELMSAQGVTIAPSQVNIPLNTAKPTSGQIILGDGSIQLFDGAVANTDGTVSLASGKSITLYLILYFDPAFFNSADIDGNNLTLRNSNPFCEQKFSITVSVGN